MQKRQNELRDWLNVILKGSPFELYPLAGDASFRRYFRLFVSGKTYIVMDAPPEKEKITAFIDIGERLKKVAVCTPLIAASNESQGFMLLEDFGDRLFLQALQTENADICYKKAIGELIKLQRCETSQLPAFNGKHMRQEMDLFCEWFVKAYLKLTLTDQERQLIEYTWLWIIKQIEAQPQTFIHRDYHSRNIMLTADNRLGIIDFQDGMQGPYAYDLVSLLKDCYIQWPREQVLHWLQYFQENSELASTRPFAVCARDFDICGLQRHLKVLGIFCRLFLRDQKPGYLQDLPLTFNYLTACLETYPELQPFYQFIHHKIMPRFIEVHQAEKINL